MINRDRLSQLVAYDPEAGLFRWIAQSRPGCRMGDVAGYTRKDGYVVIQLDRKIEFVHRLAVLAMQGIVPIQVDHINRVRNDNRWSNLRVATPALNMQNLGFNRSNTSGVKGVSWHKASGMWRAYIGINRKHIELGLFANIIDAQRARREGELRHHCSSFDTVSPVR